MPFDFSALATLVERTSTSSSFSNLCLKFVASTLKLLNATHSFSFITRFPKLDFGLSLGKCLQSIGLAHGFIFQLFSQVFKICGHHLELGQKSSTILCFGISKSLSVLKLSCDRDFTLIHICNCSFKFFNLPIQVLIFNLETFLC